MLSRVLKWREGAGSAGAKNREEDKKRSGNTRYPTVLLLSFKAKMLVDVFPEGRGVLLELVHDARGGFRGVDPRKKAVLFDASPRQSLPLGRSQK